MVLEGATALQDLAKSLGKDSSEEQEDAENSNGGATFTESAGSQEEMVKKMARMVSSNREGVGTHTHIYIYIFIYIYMHTNYVFVYTANHIYVKKII